MKIIRLIGVVGVLLFCVAAVGHAENKLRKKSSKAHQIVSLSRSPDKKSVIGVLRYAKDKASDEKLVVKTKTKIFPLVPVGDPVSDIRLLFQCTAEQALEPSFLCRDFGTSVTWSPDSQWFIIDGGAHKFWSLAVYRLQPTGPVLLEVPSYNAMAEAARRPGNLPRQKVVVHAGEPFIISLGQGVFGVHSHPYTCCDDEEDIHVYIIIDFRSAEVGRIVAVGDIAGE